MLFPIRYIFDDNIVKIVVALDRYIKENNLSVDDDTMISIDIINPKDCTNRQKLIEFKD